METKRYKKVQFLYVKLIPTLKSIVLLVIHSSVESDIPDL